MRTPACFARSFSVIASALAGALAFLPPAAAQKAIGEAVTVQKAATGTLGGRTRDLANGSEVFVNDLVQTRAASLARVTFDDDTNLAIGPSSQVKLDRFVYNPDKSARSVILSTGRGAFRFVTGESDPRGFRINTPVAAIGIRGTALDIKNEAARSVVVLEQGAAQVCVRGTVVKGPRCVTLDKPDDYAVVTRTSVQGPFAGGAAVFRFASLCGGGAICSFTKTARFAPPDRTRDVPNSRCFAPVNGLARMPALLAIEKAQSTGPSPSQSAPKDPC